MIPKVPSLLKIPHLQNPTGNRLASGIIWLTPGFAAAPGRDALKGWSIGQNCNYPFPALGPGSGLEKYLLSHLLFGMSETQRLIASEIKTLY